MTSMEIQQAYIIIRDSITFVMYGLVVYDIGKTAFSKNAT